MIPYGRQEINDSDIQAVVEVLQSDFLTQGPVVPRFESTVANYCKAKNAVAVNSATSALHIACLSLNVSKGDIVWTSPVTFVASANCALYCGAKVDFVDIDPETYNLCADALEAKLKKSKQERKLPKVVIAVHLAGQSCDMKRIGCLAKEYGFKIIEDASHAIGGQYLGKPIGSCQHSDISVFSFHPVKIITTGEGGLATTNDDALAEKMRLFRSHGITRDSNLMTKDADGGWYYQQIELGFNYRMTELQAALGNSQMERVDKFVSKRHQLKDRYKNSLQHLPLKLPKQFKDSYSALHLYPVLVELDKIEKTHAQVFEQLRHVGIGVNLHYIPIYKQPYYQKMGFNSNEFPNAESYYSRAISIPLYHGLTLLQQDEVIQTLEKVLL